MRSIGLVDFIGRQIGRFFIGQKYFGAFYQLTMGLSIVKLAWDYPIEFVPILLVIGLAFIYALGYFADKSKLSQKEMKKQLMQNVEGNRELWKESAIPQLKEMLLEVIEVTEEMKKKEEK